MDLVGEACAQARLAVPGRGIGPASGSSACLRSPAATRPVRARPSPHERSPGGASPTRVGSRTESRVVGAEAGCEASGERSARRSRSSAALDGRSAGATAMSCITSASSSGGTARGSCPCARPRRGAVLGDDHAGIRTRERTASAEQLKQHHPERVQVTAAVKWARRRGLLGDIYGTVPTSTYSEVIDPRPARWRCRSRRAERCPPW